MDIALTEEEPGKVVVHRADCPLVRRLAALGFPVATLFGLQGSIPDDLPRHNCTETPR
jgi:hypothetical protein